MLSVLMVVFSVIVCLDLQPPRKRRVIRSKRKRDAILALIGVSVVYVTGVNNGCADKTGASKT